MQVRLSIFWKIEIDNDVNSLNINTTSQKIRAHKVPADAIPEVVEDSITVMLKHSRMRVKARIAQFSDLLGKQFNTVGGVAKDDGLVDLEFGKEGVETMDLLLFFHESIVLCNAAQSKFVH